MYMYIYTYVSIYIYTYVYIYIICVHINIIHTANLIVVPRNEVILLSFGCCVWLCETTPSTFNGCQRFVGDVFGQSFRERLSGDGLASIQINNDP